MQNDIFGTEIYGNKIFNCSDSNALLNHISFGNVVSQVSFCICAFVIAPIQINYILDNILMADLTAKELNKQIVLLRKVVIAARIHAIQRLIKLIKRISNGNDEKKKRRIPKYEHEMAAIKVFFLVICGV